MFSCEFTKATVRLEKYLQKIILLPVRDRNVISRFFFLPSRFLGDKISPRSLSHSFLAMDNTNLSFLLVDIVYILICSFSVSHN